jgi:2-hydroxychromene-2-carboxylate isomerase
MKTLFQFHSLRAANFTILLFMLILTANCVLKKGCSEEPVDNSPKKIKWNSLPAVSMAGLSTPQKEAFLKFANEEICPCECPQSLAACLQTANQCEPAVALSRWVIENIRQGVPFDIMAEPLAKEIGLGFSARPQIIDLANYHAKGAKKPIITLVEFADFECAHCKTTAAALNMLLEKYPEEIKLFYKHYPLPIHPMSKAAAIASEAAGEQGKFWEMHKALFASKRALSEKQIFNIAKEIGFQGEKFTRFQSDLQSPKINEKIENSITEAQMLGLEGTPTIFFNGRPYFLSLDASGLELRIQMEKLRTRTTCR